MDFESFLSDQRDAATQAPADALAPPDNFEKFLAQTKNDATQQQAQATTVANSTQSTAAAAKAAPIGRQLGLPQSAVESDLPRFEQQARTQQNTDILRQSPVLASWVAANPDGARIAQDEYSKLSTIEKLWQGTKGIGYAALQGLGGGFNQGALALNRQIGSALGLLAPDAAASWWARNMIAPREAAQADFTPEKNFGAQAAAMSGNLLSMLSQITLTGGATGEAVPAAAGALGTIAQASKTAARAMAFPALTASTNKAADVYAATGDQAAAVKAAVAEYLFTTAQGLVPFSAPGGVATRAVTGALSGVGTSEGQRAAMNLLLPPQLRQEFDPQDALFQAVTGAVMGGVMGPRGEPNYQAQVRQTYVDALKAEQAQRDVGKVAALGKISAESKLREADPAAFRSFVEAVSDKSNLDAVYVRPQDLQAALAQSPVDISQTLPDVARQLGEGAVAGTDVRIPVADYATHIAGTELEKALLPNLKAAPDGMTLKEGQAFYQDAAKTLTERAKQIAQDHAQDVGTETDRQAVHQTIYDQLVAAGSTPEAAKSQAALHEAFYTTLAERLGMKPSEALAKYPVRIAAEGAGGFEQPVYHGSPYEIDKFSTEKIGTGEGAQSYGWGLYFAENPQVAKEYQRNVQPDAAAPPRRTFKGEEVQPGSPEYHAGTLLASPGRTLASVRKEVRGWIENAKPGEDVGHYKAVLAALDKAERKSDFKELEHKGKLYTADIPDEVVRRMLLWDEPLNRQPPEVREALKKAGLTKYVDEMQSSYLASLPEKLRPVAQKLIDAKDSLTEGKYDGEWARLMKDAPDVDHNAIHDIRDYYESGSGADLYHQLEISKGSPEAASRYLESVGIHGMKYLDAGSRTKGGTHNLVVFNHEHVTITHKDGTPITQAERDAFLQPGGQRGAYLPDTHTIALLKDADLSTFLHESGHHFLEVMRQVASGEKAPADLKGDFDTLLRSFKVEGATPEERLENWNARDLQAQREGHEQFAQSFEKYLMEGKAPTFALQPMFSRFRSWLLNVYRSFRGLGVQLDPEVRGVMDRLLASDTLIKEAEAARSYAPLFRTAAEAGMTDEQFKAYTELGQEATSKALDAMQAKSVQDMKWASNAKSRALRQLQREAAGARRETTAEVTKEVDAMPIFQLKDYLAGIKNYDPDIVAEAHGFEDASHMQQALQAAGDKQEAIRKLTDQRMLEKYGELLSPETIEMAANDAVHNEARARFMATGLKVLTKSPLPAAQIAKAAKEAADIAIGMKRVMDINPKAFQQAESRANRDAIKAAAKDPQAAIEAQRSAVLSNRLAKSAQDALAEVDKGVRYLRRFDTPAMAQKVGAEYMDRINELLSQYDITNRTASKSDIQTRQDMRAWLNSEFERTGIMPEVSDGLLDFAQRRHWKELPFSEFVGLVDAVKSLEHVGRNQTTLTLLGKKMQLADLVARVQSDLADLPHNEPVNVQPHLQHANGLDKISAQFLNLKSKVRGMDAALVKMEQLFQWLSYGKRAGLGESKSGPFLEVFQRAADAEGAERAMRAESVEDMRRLAQTLRDAKVNLNESLNLPLQRPGRGGQWYREELIAAALNTGNEGNLDKLTKGYRWDRAQLMQVLDANLSKTEWQFVQGVWDAIGKYGPQIEALQKRLTGVAPKMIEPSPVKTQYGEFKGGYYPVVYDAFLDRSIEQKYAKDSAALFENQFSKPMTSHGHTVERTGYTGPVQLSLGVVARHIDQVTHDLAWREAIIDMNKFLSHKAVQSEVDQVMGREYTRQFRPWLQAMANDKVFNTAGDSAWESFYRKARTNATLVGLGFRLSTMMIHGGSALSNSIGELGTHWFAKGAAEFATPERWERAKQFMYERSPEMANRFNGFDRNVQEAIDQMNEHQRALGPMSATQKAVDGARRFAFYGVQALDMGSAAPTWMGAYLKGLAPAEKGGLGMSEDKALDYANRAVRNAHGGGGIKDLSAVQRDKGVMSLATMFYSFWNHMYNRQRDLAKGYMNLRESVRGGTGTRDFAKLLARSWWYFVIPQLIHAYLKPAPQQNDQEDTLASHLTHLGEEIALGFVSGVPVLRDLANAAINGRDYAITPLEQAGKSIVKASSDTYKFATGEEPSAHAGKNAALAAGYVMGLPTGQAATAGPFLWDVFNGDADAQGIKEWYSGVTSGHVQ